MLLISNRSEISRGSSYRAFPGFNWAPLVGRWSPGLVGLRTKWPGPPSYEKEKLYAFIAQAKQSAFLWCRDVAQMRFRFSRSSQHSTARHCHFGPLECGI